MYLCNPRSPNNKFDEFSAVINELDVDIAGIAESWFSESKPIEYFEIDKYLLITKSRTDKRGGGVAFYACEDLRAQRPDIAVPDDSGVDWMKVRPQRLPRAVFVLFYAIFYFPTDSSNESKLIDHLL